MRVERAGNDGRAGRDFALDRLGEDPVFAEWVRSGAIETMHTLETTLEDVFVEVTGRALA